MIEKYINIKKYSKKEIDYLEHFFKIALKENSKQIAKIKLIEEAKKAIQLKPLKEKGTFINNFKLKIGNVLIEITKKKIKDSNVEFSKKISEAMNEDYIRDLMLYNEDFLNLLKNSNLNNYITIYANYGEKEK